MIKKPCLLAIRCYQRLLSPLFGASCRHQPTCSVYTYEAIDLHGPLRGTSMGFRRIARCRPGRDGGYDPVPPRKSVA